MMSVVQSGSLSGVTAHGVRVEASPIRGLPGFDIVGMPEAGIRESRVRVLAALRNSGYELPERRFVVNLAPADLRKAGSSFDLAIAIALLAQCGLCAPNQLEHTLIVGELSLDGQLRSVRGLLSQLRSASLRGLRAALIPAPGASWARLCTGLDLLTIGKSIRLTLDQSEAWRPVLARLPVAAPVDRYPRRARTRAAIDAPDEGLARHVSAVGETRGACRRSRASRPRASRVSNAGSPLCSQHLGSSLPKALFAACSDWDPG